MVRRLIPGALLGIALLACALLPAYAAPKAVLAGVTNGTVSFWAPYPGNSTYTLDMALVVAKEGTAKQWGFHWDDGTVHFIHRNANSIWAINGPTNYPGTGIPVSFGISGAIMDPGSPQRDLYAVISASKGYIWDQGTKNWPDSISLVVYENLGAGYVPVYNRYGWFGTRADGVQNWTTTSSWLVFGG